MNKIYKLIFTLAIILFLVSCTPENKSFVITFATNGGSLIESIVADKDQNIIMPNDPTKEGYTFGGWYLDSEFTQKLLSDYTLNDNITLYAKWKVNQYTISFDTGEGSEIDSITQDYGTVINSAVEPTRVGYTFDGWYVNEALTQTYTFSTMTAEDITLYAKWVINSYTLQFLDSDGTVLRTHDYEFNMDLSSVTPPTATKEGYTFDGWDKEIPATMPAENVTITALWNVNQYTISFDTGEGSEIDSITQDYGTVVNFAVEPTRVGYTFDGWYVNEALTQTYTFSTMTAEDITLYAKWVINQYKIDFLTFDGIVLKSEKYTYQEDLTNIIAPNDPEREGHTFNGWDKEIPATMPAENVTITALWNVNQYTISYAYLNDGINFNPFLKINEKIVTISMGINHSIALTSEGRVFTWGSNNLGQLGNGENTTQSLFPVEITSKFILEKDDFLVDVIASEDYSAALSSKGKVFMWGSNEYGRLGLGFQTNIPYELTSKFSLNQDDRIVQLSLGLWHVAALSSQGRVFTWGSNGSGRLGTVDIYNKSFPTEITSNFDLDDHEIITQVSFDGWHSAALSSKGKVFMWGWNADGQLGNSMLFDIGKPLDITSQFNLITDEFITKIEIGRYNSTAVTSKNRLFAWGDNTFNQVTMVSDNDVLEPLDVTNHLNLNTNEYVVDVQSGYWMTSVLTSAGRVLTWGYNVFGQLGDGTNVSTGNPLDITHKFNLTSGEIVLNVSIKQYQTAVLTTFGRLFTWGFNGTGQLGHNHTNITHSPSEIIFNQVAINQIMNVNYNDEIPKPIIEREGFKFNGWYYDIEGSHHINSDKVPSNDILLYASWTILPTYNETEYNDERTYADVIINESFTTFSLSTRGDIDWFKIYVPMNTLVDLSFYFPQNQNSIWRISVFDQNMGILGIKNWSVDTMMTIPVNYQGYIYIKIEAHPDIPLLYSGAEVKFFTLQREW